jgi:predicted  nucleic acid-binding Zn-ribbon protein
MSLQTLEQAGLLSGHSTGALVYEEHHNAFKRAPLPATTLQIIEAAIESYRSIEDEGERIFEQARSLLAHVATERRRMRTEAEKLRVDLTESQLELLSAQKDLAAAKARAKAAEHRARDLEERTKEITRICLRLVEAVEPMLGRDISGIGLLDQHRIPDRN